MFKNDSAGYGREGGVPGTLAWPIKVKEPVNIGSRGKGKGFMKTLFQGIFFIPFLIYQLVLLCLPSNVGHSEVEEEQEKFLGLCSFIAILVLTGYCLQWNFEDRYTRIKAQQELQAEIGIPRDVLLGTRIGGKRDLSIK